MGLTGLALYGCSSVKLAPSMPNLLEPALTQLAEAMSYIACEDTRGAEMLAPGVRLKRGGIATVIF